METVEELINELPPEIKKEVYDFARFLLESKVHHRQRKMRLTWAGALREYRNKYTSLGLQKSLLNGGAIDVPCGY